MVDRAVRRAGAGAAVLGAVIGVIFNVMHPRATGFGVAEELELVSGSSIWLLDHFMLLWTVMLYVVGLAAIGLSMQGEPARSWGWVAALTAAASGAVGLALIFIDGMAANAVAQAWAADPGTMTLAAGSAVSTISMALFTGLMFTMFGITPVLFGVAALRSADHSKWLAYLAMGAGLLGLVTGSIQYLNGPSALTANALFPLSSVAFTIWIGLAGWNLWTRSAAPAAAPAKEAIA